MIPINSQPISKSDQRDDGSLEVHSVFYTIQGEGPLTGHPAVFVRLAGCNLQCPMCDTEYTLGKLGRMSPEALMVLVREAHPAPRLVVITGGEPFRQNITLFTSLLLDEGYQVQVETNGTLPPPLGMLMDVMIVVSPKTGKVAPELLYSGRAFAFKYVLDHRSVDPEDGLPLRALDHTAHPRVARPPEDMPLGAIYVQPADAKSVALNLKNLEAVKHTCLKHGYTLQLQTHKLIDME